MFWWIVDNITLVLVVLGVIALCFGAAWWSFRKNNLLIGVAGPIALMVLAWVLSLFIVTDRMQLVRNVDAVCDLINAGKFDELNDYFEEDIILDSIAGRVPIKRGQIKNMVEGNKKKYNTKKIFFNQIDVEDLSRPTAMVSFIVGREEGAERARCRVEHVLGPDGKWRGRVVTVTNIVGDQKLLFPF